MTCPICRGATALRELLLETLCNEHRAAVVTPSEAELLAAIEEGVRDCEAVERASAHVVMPLGYSR